MQENTRYQILARGEKIGLGICGIISILLAIYEMGALPWVKESWIITNWQPFVAISLFYVGYSAIAIIRMAKQIDRISEFIAQKENSNCPDQK